MSELPKNWEWSRIGDIGIVASGGTPSTQRSDYYDGEIPWITPKDLSGYTEKYISVGSRSITQNGLNNSSAKILPKGTVLFSSRAPIGYCVIAATEVATNQGFKNLIPSEGVLSDYVYHYLKGNKQLAENYASGTTFLEISGKAFSNLPIPLPPLPEQRRIVARIEELFSHLDAGVVALRHAKAQLQRYRQSVLAAAVTGELTKEWREQHPDTEPAEELLKQILKRRREQWDGRGKYSEPASPKPLTFDLPSSSWARVSIDQLAVDTTIGLVRAAVLQNSCEEGFAYLKMDKIDMNGRVNLDELVYVDATKDEVERFSLRKGDVLFNTRNSVELVGKTGHVASEPVTPLVFNNNLMRIRFVDSALPAFVALQMCSKQFRERMEGAKRATTSIAAVYGKDLRPLPIALPPLAEQHQIVTEVEARTTAIDHLEAELDRQIIRSNRLRQSILSSAFRGII